MSEPTGSEAVGAGVWAEREVSVDEARRRVECALAELGLSPVLSEVGSGPALAVWSCRLLDASSAPAPLGLGMGKGRPTEAHTGAVFEALEHYQTGPALLDMEEITFQDGQRLAAGPLAGHPFAPLLADAGRLACHTYRPLPGARCRPDRALMTIPVCLTTSWYTDRPELRRLIGDDADYRHLARYAGNSGSAIGISRTEALLHAVNECVERDALSVLIARAFLRPRSDFRLRRIEPASLPTELAAAHHQAEEQVGGPVDLLDISSDLGLPVYAALTPGSAHLETRSGFGASLSHRHAAFRALSEILQTTLATRSSMAPGPTRPVDLIALRRYPALYACGRCDFTSHLEHAEAIPFPTLDAPALTPAQQLDEVTRLLTSAGHVPYYRTIATLPTGITSVHVFTPGLERFVAVANGMLVLPGPRARGHLSTA